MDNLINKIVGDIQGKKEWKALEVRANALPPEYKLAYDEIKQYVWHGGTGLMDPSNMFKRLVEAFEAGAAAGKTVLDVTGADVAAFVDSLARDDETYMNNLRTKLNSTVAERLGKK